MGVEKKIEDIQKELKNYLFENEIHKVLKRLDRILEPSSILINEVQLLNSAYLRILKRKSLGQAESEISKNRIYLALFEIINRLGESDVLPSQKVTGKKSSIDQGKLVQKLLDEKLILLNEVSNFSEAETDFQNTSSHQEKTPDKNNDLHTLLKLIGRDELEKVFNRVEKLVTTSSDLQRMAYFVLMKNRWWTYKKEMNNSLASREDLLLEKNKIVNTLIIFITDFMGN